MCGGPRKEQVTTIHHLTKAIGVASAALLTSCTQPVPIDMSDLDRIGAATALDACCNAKRKLPPAVTRLVESCALPAVTTIQSIKLRRPHLAAQPAAQDKVFELAKPLDLLAISNKGHVSGQLSMGYFSHFSVFVGDEAALRAAGVWDAPEVRPWQDALSAGPMVIEAMAPEVALAGRDKIFDADAVAVLRPRSLPTSRKRAALRDIFAMLGMPFDAHFDARTSDAMFCTEVPARAIPELNLPERMIYGRPSYLPDETVAQSIQGKIPLTLVAYVEGSRTGWSARGADVVAARILAYWPQD